MSLFTDVEHDTGCAVLRCFGACDCKPGPVYLTKPIAAKRENPIDSRRYMTRGGYTKRSGAPIGIMIRLVGEARWRRVMVWQFSNAGTCFVRIKGVPHIVRDV